MKRLLIAYNETSFPDNLLLDLSRSGLPGKLEVRVLCPADVWVPPRTHLDPGQEAALPQEIARARHRALRFVQAQSDLAGQVSLRIRNAFPGWHVSSESPVGPPPQTVAAAAREWNADLVIAAWPAPSGLRRFLGENAPHKIALLSPCSVRIAKPIFRREKRAPRVVLALAGYASAAVVESIVNRDWPVGSLFHLVSVVDPKMTPEDYRSTLYTGDWMNQHDASANDIISRTIQAAEEQLHRAGLATDTHIFEGHTGPTLLQHVAALEVDSLVLGATGWDPQSRPSLGSVAGWLTDRAPCSVEIIRPASLPSARAEPGPSSRLARCALA